MDSPRSSQLNTHRSSEMDTHRSEGNASNRSIASSSSAENRRSLRVHIEETKALPDELKARMLETLSRDSSSNHSTPDQRTPREPPPPLRGASPWHTTSRVDTPLLAQKRGPAVPVRSVSLGLSEGKAKASDGMPGSKKRKKKLKASLSVEDELAQLAAANRASLARAHAHRVLSLPSSRLLEDSVNSELAFREALAAQLDSLAKQRAAKDVKEFTPEPTPEPSVVDVEREYIQRLRARTPESQLDLRALFLRRLTGDRAPPRGGPDEEGRSRASSAERRELGRSRFAEARPKSSASQNNAVASRGASEGHEAKEKQKPVRLRNMFSSLKSVTAPGKRGWGMPDPGKKKRIARVDYNSDSESVNTLPEKQIADEESPGPKRIPFRTIFAKTSTYSDWVFEHQLEAWKPREVVNGIATPVVVRSPAGTPPQLRTPERQSHRSRAGSPLDFRMEGSKMADGEQRRKKGVKGEVSPRLRLLEGTDSQLFRMEGEELEDELSEMLIAGHGQGKDGSEPGTKAPRFLFPGERDSDAMSADESASEPVVAIGAAIQPEEKPKKKLKKKRSRAKRRSSGPSSELLASIEKARKAKAREMLPSLFPEGGMSDLSRGPPGAKHLPARAHERPPSGGGLGPYSGAAARRGVGRIKTNGNVGGYMGRGGAMGAAHNVSGVGLAAKNGGIVRGPGTGKGSETGTKGMSVRKGGFRASIEGEDSSSSDGESSDDDESEGEAGGENKPETQEGGPENADQGGEENATEGGGEDEETKADEILIDDESVAGDWEEDIGEVAEKPEAAIKGIEKQRVEVPAPMRPRRVGGAGRDEG